MIIMKIYLGVGEIYEYFRLHKNGIKHLFDCIVHGSKNEAV